MEPGGSEIHIKLAYHQSLSAMLFKTEGEDSLNTDLPFSLKRERHVGIVAVYEM